MAQIVSDNIHPCTPLDMNNLLKAHGLFVKQDLIANDNVLHTLFPNVFAPSQVSGKPIDLNRLQVLNGAVIIEVDFDHDPSDGITTHFLLVQGYNPQTQGITVGDPWYGTVDPFSKHYGTDKKQTILKIIHYPLTPKPAPPAPTPAPTPIVANPVPPKVATVTADLLGVYGSPDTTGADNLSKGTPDGRLRKGNTFTAVGTYGDFLFTKLGHWVPASGTDFNAPPTPAPVAEAISIPVVASEPVIVPTTPNVVTGTIIGLGSSSGTIHQETNAVADFTPKWVKTLQDIPVMDTVSNLQALKGEKRQIIPAGLTFKVDRLKRSNGSIYYNNPKLRSMNKDWGIKTIDVQDAEDPEVTALSAIANLPVVQRIIPATIHALHGQGFLRWLSAKK